MTYIDKESLIKEFEVEECKESQELLDLVFSAVRAVIERQPTADVAKVVKCEDCKWYINNRRCGHPFGLSGESVLPTDFCSHGERGYANGRYSN